jgi:hypothetical protein
MVVHRVLLTMPHDQVHMFKELPNRRFFLFIANLLPPEMVASLFGHFWAFLA